MSMVALVLESAKTDDIVAAMKSVFSGKSGFFENEAAVLDLTGIADKDATPNFNRLHKEASKYGLRVVAVKGGSISQTEAAFASGLADGDSANVGLAGLKERAQPKVVAKAPAAEQATAKAPQETGWLPPLIVEGPLRAGQTVYAQGRDLVVMSGVNAGAEVIADGSVHIYGALRGRALAGAKGFDKACIFAHSLESELVAVAGIFETAEGGNLSALKGRSVLVTLKATSVAAEGGEPDGNLVFKNLSAPVEAR